MLRVVRAEGERLEYELVQTHRRSLEIRVDLFGQVRLFTPRGYPLRASDDFVRGHAAFIRDARARGQDYQNQREQAHPVRDGASILLEGQLMTLRIRKGPYPRLERSGEELIFTTPRPQDEGLREELRQLLARLTQERIESALAHWGPLVGKPWNAVTIRDQKTRWGSCSSKGNLNFNWKLIMAPPQALEYVVIHELCHLVEFNHSARFWHLVSRYQSDYETWKSWLKKNGALLGL